MSLRCIAFDLDDTLWPNRPVLERAEAALYDWLSRHYPTLSQHYTHSELMQNRLVFADQHPEWQHDVGLLRLRWLQQLALHHKLNPALAQEAFAVFYQARQQVELFPQVLEQLQRLKQHYLLGVITNGNADVHHMSFGYLFDFSLSAAQAGVAKPNPMIFRQAAALASVRTAEMVYIGDDLEKDIEGAQQAGMKTIWFNPFAAPPPQAIRPDLTMTNFAEINRLIQLL